MKFWECVQQIENESLPIELKPLTICDPSVGLAIGGVSKLPPHPAFYPESLPEQLVWLSSQTHYKIMAYWLWHLLLGQELHPDLLKKPYIYEKPFAEIAVATFRLSVGVHPRSNNSIIRQFKNPASLWFACQWGNSLKFLRDTGLTSHPVLVGKKEQYNHALQTLRDLQEHKLRLEPSAIKNYPTGVLLLEAQEISKSDQALNFHYDYLMPFIRTLRRELRKISDCKEIQMGFILEDGSLYRTGRSKKLPKVCKEI